MYFPLPPCLFLFHSTLQYSVDATSEKVNKTEDEIPCLWEGTKFCERLVKISLVAMYPNNLSTFYQGYPNSHKFALPSCKGRRTLVLWLACINIVLSCTSRSCCWDLTLQDVTPWLSVAARIVSAISGTWIWVYVHLPLRKSWTLC